MGEILQKVTSYGFHITNIKMIQLTQNEVTEYYPAELTNDET